MTSLILSPCCILAETDAQGESQISIRVPGTFGKLTDGTVDLPRAFLGYDPNFPEGRYLNYSEMWVDDPMAGDRVTLMQVVDSDGVIPENMRSQFPQYPVIQTFFDQEIIETSNLKAGLFLTNTPAKIGAVGEVPVFVPAGLYIQGAFKGGSQTQGRKLRCNMVWGKRVA